MHPLTVVLDLDGTAVRYDPRFEIDPVLTECLGEHLAAGERWMMNSDRSVAQMIEIAEYLPPELRPCAILARQQEIHLKNGCGYVPHAPYNEETGAIRHRLWYQIEPFFVTWRKEIEAAFEVLHYYADKEAFAFRTHPEESEDLRGLLEEMLAPWPEAAISGNQDWSFIIHRTFSKGAVLQATAKLLGIPADSILAVGDGLNDVTMLDGSVTPKVGCPANACRETLAAVRAAGGVVSELAEAEGTADVIRQYRAGESA